MFKGFSDKLSYLFSNRKKHLTLFLVLIFSLLLSTTLILSHPPLKKVLGNSSFAWNINTNSEYTYDDTKIEFSGGVAQLKASGTPGVDWIANDGLGNSWGYRKAITVDNTQTASILTDYQTVMTIDTQALVSAGKMSSDCKDIRFTDNDKITPLNFWLESGCNTTTTRVWIKVPSIPASSTATIYLYYGDSSATSASNGNNTFILFDDFNDNSIDVTKWTVVDPGNKFSESGSKLNFIYGSGAGNWNASIYSNQNFSRSELSFEFNYKRTSAYSPYNAFMWGWKDTTTGVSYANLVHGEYSQADAGCTVNCTNPNYEKGAGTGSITWQQALDYVVRLRLKSTAGVYYDQSTDGGVTWTTAQQTSAYNDTPLKVAWMHYSGDEIVDNAKVRKWTANEPALSAGSETIFYSTTNPTLTPNTGQGYTTISAFTQTLGAGSSGAIKYQVSPDNGVTWYWWSGATWATTIAGYTEANTASDVNTNIGSFSAGSNPKTFKWKAYFNSDGSQQPKLDNLNITYVWDTADPDNPATVTTLSQLGGTALTTNTWYNHTAPYFSWTEPTDNAGVGEVASGIAGYYVYFGTTATADPHTTGSYQVSRTYTASSLLSGSTYYLRIETKDNAGNIKNIAPENASLFIYKYDGDNPNSPVYISASPSGYTRTNSFTFSWPTSGGNMATDTGGSGLAGYNYKINSGSWSGIITGGSIVLTDIATTGVNVFYFRAVDNAGGYDLTPVQTNFYYNNSSPTTPQNLTVTPTVSGTNSFAFSWSLPISYSGSIAGYYYSINALPTLVNVSYTTATSLPADAYATQQGVNTFYIVAKDESGNYDLGSCQSIQNNPTTDSCTKVEFTANTSAPGIPTTVQIFDISNRDTKEYAITLKWTAPVNQGAGFSGYEVYRSATGSGYESIGSTTGTTYADTGLSSHIYYYYVKSKDNAGQYSAASSVVSVTPTGKYTSPPKIVATPKITISSYSAVITWQTDREGSSFVEYGTGAASLGTVNGGETKGQLDQTMDHSVSLKGLQPNTTYYYQAVWVDVDGNRGASDTLSFLTKPAPKVTDLDSKTNITLNSILVNWSTTVTAYCVLNYGATTDYGGVLKEFSGTYASAHSLNLTSLDHSTTYHFQISCLDSENNVFTSDDYKETTLTMPLISEFRFETIDAPTTTVKFSWKTNVPTTTVATYQVGSDPLQSQSAADYKTDHEIIISNLEDKTSYVLQAKGVDEHGNMAESEKSTFTTPDDTRPPKLNGMTIEVRTSGFGQAQKAQVVVAWQTDESSTSQVEYSQGISGQDYSFKSKEDIALATNHVVIVSDLEPSKIYHLRAISKDAAKNAGISEDTTVITGKVQKSVTDIIINSLSSSLGWLFRVFQ
ncbi:MAG: DUF2341 domain-containing protein [Patescibacteria group bacterium]|nr:DUF2341 domain-containing protein [Patescibacteria group bacterium]